MSDKSQQTEKSTQRRLLKAREEGTFVSARLFISALQFMAFVAVLVGPMIAIVAIVATQWRRVRVAELDAGLKQQMLDKGMSAAEIEQVMKASQEPSDAAGLEEIVARVFAR